MSYFFSEELVGKLGHMHELAYSLQYAVLQKKNKIHLLTHIIQDQMDFF